MDPRGYVYVKNREGETRIAGSTVSLYWLNPETKKYELWPAKTYLQANPQTTDKIGEYSFLVPPGQYYLTVESPRYLKYQGDVFTIKEGSIVDPNIQLKKKFWLFRILGF